MATRAVGGGRCWISGYVTGVVDLPPFSTTVFCVLIASGVPPVGGGLFVYHHRSMVFTIPLPPLSRIHSTVRTEMVSLPGLLR